MQRPEGHFGKKLFAEVVREQFSCGLQSVHPQTAVEGDKSMKQDAVKSTSKERVFPLCLPVYILPNFCVLLV